MNSWHLFGPKTVISSRFRAVFTAAMFSMVSAYILILTDNVAAGQLVGEKAVVSMTLVVPLLTFIIFVSYLIADGLAMMLSYAMGRGDREQVDRLFSMGVMLALGMGGLFALGMWALRTHLLGFWDISPQLMGYVQDYYDGLLFYAPLMFLNVFFYTVFVAEGQERVCVVGSVCAFVVNVLLDICLCLRIGVMGVGIATTCGLGAAVLVQLYFLWGGHSRLHFRWYWNTNDVLHGVFYSFYHSLDTLLLALLPLDLSSCVLHHFSEAHIIVVTVTVNLLTFIVALYTGVVDCLQPMVCQYHAEKNLPSIQKTMATGIRATNIISLAIMVLGMAVSGILPQLFGVRDEQMVAEVSMAVCCFLLFIMFLGCTLMYSNYYIYIEKRNYGACLKFLLLLGFPYIGMELGAAYSLNGMMLGTSAAFLAAFGFNLWWTRKSGRLFLDREMLTRQYSYDIDCSVEAVIGLSRLVQRMMAARGLSVHRANLLALLVEEIGMHANQRAKGAFFQLEFSILLGKKSEDDITMIVRDNGKPYDIIKEALQGKHSFREYFIESITANFPRRHYWVSGDENRMTLVIGERG
ncbi:MATE family efflux transporter [Selenomonas ruminantium]|uniref:Na+-driven multidrug efflux pump n=1 Tax=Selenomonas ruminantium TaxID=971 RepID=A0A1H3Y8C7_SELRU|nr:MATE family efflux transporter [Selenomonas ruminantium]SEA07875.1 Na+-driven multidrug efflux pump [Selenomonas ruminantium]